MVSFSHVLDAEKAEAVHAYLIKRAHDAKKERAILAGETESSGESDSGG
jgi:hypothetical protein